MGLSWGSGFEVTAAAAAGGQLKALQWLRARGCPWDASCCTAAAKNGNEELLRWAIDAGCPFQRKACFVEAKQQLRKSEHFCQQQRLTKLLWWGAQAKWWTWSDKCSRSGSGGKLLPFTAISPKGATRANDAVARDKLPV